MKCCVPFCHAETRRFEEDSSEWICSANWDCVDRRIRKAWRPGRGDAAWWTAMIKRQAVFGGLVMRVKEHSAAVRVPGS